MSLAEAVTKPLLMNIIASFLWTYILAPIYGFEFPLAQSFSIGIGFLITSICLGYVVRRFFNTLEERHLG